MEQPKQKIAPAVEIGLATFNGALYLRDQLESLFAQTLQDFVIIARDDGSVDNTVTILREYEQSYPGRLQILPCSGKRLGACANFGRIAARFSADYAFFCDQDDVWLPDKIEKSLRGLRSLEDLYGANTPLLIHTDLQVTAADLRVLYPSLIQYAKLNPIGRSFASLLVQSMVAGCTTVFNSALYRRALPIPPHAMMHDSWFALVAGAFGRSHFLPEATILYRQHGTNMCGARRPSWSKIFAKASLAVVDHPADFLRYVRQAQAFLTRFEDELPDRQRTIVRSVAHIPSRSPLAAMRELMRHGISGQGLVRNAALFASTAFLANSPHVTAIAEFR